MSVQFDGSATAYLIRTATAPDYNAAYTFSCWVRPEDTATWREIIEIDAGSNNYDMIVLDGAGNFMMELAIGGSFPDSATFGYSINTWYFVALRRNSATSIDMWITSATQASLTNDVSGRTASTGLEISGHSALIPGNNDMLGRIAQARLWTRALSDGELATEKASATMVSTTNAWAEWRLVNLAGDTTDSFDSRPLTAGSAGLSTGADDPPGQGGGASGFMWLK